MHHAALHLGKMDNDAWDTVSDAENHEEEEHSNSHLPEHPLFESPQLYNEKQIAAELHHSYLWQLKPTALIPLIYPQSIQISTTANGPSKVTRAVITIQPFRLSD